MGDNSERHLQQPSNLIVQTRGYLQSTPPASLLPRVFSLYIAGDDARTGLNPGTRLWRSYFSTRLVFSQYGSIGILSTLSVTPATGLT
jgi:hypothetical protein